MASENEKLRALLAEARETLLAQHDPQDNIALTARIDAALAEPPADVAVTLTPAQRDDVIEVLEAAQRDDLAIEKIEELLEANGCDCPCDCSFEEHDEECGRCLACRIAGVLEECAHAE